MNAGDKVLVYPHGSPQESARGSVVIISGNHRSIAVGFDEMPPFLRPRGAGVVAMHPLFGVILMATRVELNGNPWGPWVDVGSGGHFEIEEAHAS